VLTQTFLTTDQNSKGKGGFDFNWQLRVFHASGHHLQPGDDVLGIGEGNVGKVADCPAGLEIAAKWGESKSTK